MDDEVIDETPALGAPPKPKKRTRRTGGFLDSKQVKALALAEQIVVSAERAEHFSRLSLREITSAKLTAIQDEVNICREIATRAVQSAARKSGMTAEESAARLALLEAIREIQAAANQKYARSQPAKLAQFYVGTVITRSSRAMLTQIVSALIDMLDSNSGETLPGITAAKVKTLKTLKTEWVGANSSQSANQSDATRARAELTERLKNLTDMRLEVQFAADAEYPYTRESDHAARTEFGLPLTRPLRARG